MAHARRKFHELHVTGKSQIAEQALVLIQKLYAIEAELRKRRMVQRKTAANTDNRIVNRSCNNYMNGSTNII